MLRFKCGRLSARLSLLVLLAAWALMLAMTMLSVTASAQTTPSTPASTQAAPVPTGSIAGKVADPQGAAVAAARVTITNKATAQGTSVTTTSSGTYASGALAIGDYLVSVEVFGFEPGELTVTVQANAAASGNVKLFPSQTKRMEHLPMNGRRFLDLAQLQPGVQIPDGNTFDPTKNGYSSISVDSRFGRAARIEVDGVDLSDETVGGSTQNLPLGSIQEAAVQYASPDFSNALGSSGSVNIVTKSGTDALHGEGFFNFRDQQFDAALPGGSKKYFQRNQFGGNVGGALVKDKLFFFLDGERNKQDLIAPALGGGDFSALTSSFASPLRETQAVGRLDYQTQKYRAFYRFSFDQNRSVFPFIPNSFQPFTSENNARDHVLGVDFSRGSYTHSIRFSYSKFQNGITDAVASSGILPFAPGLELAIGADPSCTAAGLDNFCSGPSYLAPQTTFQSNEQIKYDGSRPKENHNFRFGVGFNRLQGGGFSNFLGLAPAVGSPSLSPGVQPPCFAAGTCPDQAGGAADPLNYPAYSINLGNGQGFSSEKSAFGYPGGGLGPDNRISWYAGDTWKFRPNLTLTLGVSYVRDTGRTDSDIAPIAALSQFNVSNNQFYTYSGLNNRVHQPNLDLSPQFGFAWDPDTSGKTVIRGGAGLFYENSIWNNSLFDRSARLARGEFLGFTSVCSSGAPQTLPFATTVNPASICGQPIGNVASQVTQLEQQYQAATAAAGSASNPNYIANSLADGININGTQLLAPSYVTPRSLQMNLGFQREIHPGAVLSVDFLRTVSTRELLSIDTNHVGDARFFNPNAALAAINATVGPACGGGSVTYGGAPGAIQCFITNNPTATISAFASNGLDSGYSDCGGRPCALIGRPAAAYPGINSALGANQMLFPIGRSVYQGVQATWKQDVEHPLQGVRHANFQVSYAYSKYVSSARDGDTANFAQDNVNPLKYMGPNGLDRKHQFSIGGVADLPAGFHLSTIAHFDSPLPLSVTLPVSGNSGGIFQTDITGDGTGDGSFASNGGLGDLLPGTKAGAFGRSLNVNGLNQVISNYNLKWVGTLTPAGTVLLNSGLFTQSELTALQAVIGGNQNGSGTIAPLRALPAGAVEQGWLKSFDVGLNWSYKFKEKVEFRPGVTFFNVLNLANFESPSSPFTSVLNGQPGSANGTISPQPNALRLGLGSGVSAAGSPRVMEFELKIKF
ncbi:MAG TPA: carboxypeptidase regulatory-like domain-containing protein [Candidatus Sulfotelmatobacter sp.]|nr:carboxypeptidase regulatory-like domain-containing protein [Candidatus Sulfotelmatobacter sp.]